MPPSNPFLPTRRHCLAMLPAVGLMSSLTSSAQAHTISIIRGSAVVHPDRIEVELTINAEDFIHYYGLRAAEGRPLARDLVERAAARHADHLLEHIIIRDAEGEPVPGRVASHRAGILDDRTTQPHSSYVTFPLEYRLRARPAFLSFQQTLGAGQAALPSQLYLGVRAAGADDAKMLRLTSGGNVETLRFDWPSEGNPGALPVIAGPLEELKSVAARLEITDAETRLQVDIPLPLLETFLPIVRADRDFLDPAEQQAAQRAAEHYLRERFPVLIDGLPVASRGMKITLLGLSTPESATPPQRLGAWTTRVRARLSYLTASPPQEADLRWALFNPVVLEVDAVVVRDYRESTYRLSTYEPTLRWGQGTMKNTPVMAKSGRSSH